MLEIKNLHASVEDTKILKGLNLSVNKGEVHAIMGPNGSGKSTLASVIAGRDDFDRLHTARPQAQRNRSLRNDTQGK